MFGPTTYEEAKARFKPLQRVGRKKPAKDTSRGKISSRSPRAPGAPRPKKKLTTGQWKKKAWTQFSIYIRTRYADAEGIVKCVTCDARKHWKEMQAGHFIRGRLNANLFERRGCHAQCYACNVGRQGNVVLYYKFMLATYGQAVIDELIEQNNKTRKWQAGELEELYKHYKELNAKTGLDCDNVG